QYPGKPVLESLAHGAGNGDGSIREMPCQTGHSFRWGPGIEHILKDSNQKGLVAGRAGGRVTPKNAGSATVTLNPRSQPRLPGSVVGEASMLRSQKTRKITKVTVPR